MRKQSPETQVRHLKREVKVQDQRIGELFLELGQRRRIGAILANICFNGKHHSGIPEDFRSSMSVALTAWEAIRRTL